VLLLLALLLGLATLVGEGDAYALEGIQGRYTIFYPSIELLYYHTDNLYLQPDNEVDSNQFVVRPTLWFEVPTDQHYFSISYTPQYRDVEEFDLDDEWSHFVDMEGKFQASPVFRVEMDYSFVYGVLETQEVDPDGELVFGLDPFDKNDLRADFIWEGQKQGADFYAGWFKTSFDRDTPSDANPTPEWLEREHVNVGIEYFYKFTPLSKFFVGFEHVAADHDYTAGWETDPYSGHCIGGACLGTMALDADSNKVYFGFQGELGRTSTGRISAGYQDTSYDDIPMYWLNDPTQGMNPFYDRVSDYSGLVVDGTFTKGFTRFTKVEVNLRRAENPSNYEGNAFYRANRLGFQLTNQPLGRKVFWSIGGYFQRNSYPDPTDLGGGMMKHREDDNLVARAEIGYHPLTHLNVKVNFTHQDRDSNMPNRAFDFEENVILFQLGLGY
jgi:hypothetical protein